MKTYNITVNGVTYTVSVEEVGGVAAPAAAPVAAPAAAQAVSAEGTTIPSPMPGSILNVNVTVGQAVKAGDVLMILEAMKMENDISAPCDGTVKSINAPKGSTVNTDDVIAVI